jgi:hypothetical protein
MGLTVDEVMELTPRELSRWTEGYNVRFALDARLHGAKVEVPVFDAPQSGPRGADPAAIEKIRERLRAETAEKMERLGIPER